MQREYFTQHVLTNSYPIRQHEGVLSMASDEDMVLDLEGDEVESTLQRSAHG
jgi:hypothetical protein